MANIGTVNVQFFGLQPLKHRLENMAKPEKLEQALDMAALVVEKAAKGYVRRDTSRLYSSINIKRSKLTRKIGTSVVYAAAQEFGRGDIPRYGYTPYLRPALRNNKKEINRIILNSLKE